MHGLIEELQQFHHDKAHHLDGLQVFSLKLVDPNPSALKEELTELFAPLRSGLEQAHQRNEELILLHLGRPTRLFTARSMRYWRKDKDQDTHNLIQNKRYSRERAIEKFL